MALAFPARLLAAVLVMVAAPAMAAELGEVLFESAPGEPLRAAVPVFLAAGEAFGPECVSLARGPRREGPFVTRATVTLEGTGTHRVLRIFASTPTPPRARLRVVARCPGEEAFAYREYLPFAGSAARDALEQAPAPPVRRPPPRPRTPATEIAPAREPASTPKAPAPVASPRPVPSPRADRKPEGPFVLRLSTPALDLSRSTGLDDAARARLRARQLVLDNDDQVAAFLALRDNVRRLEGRIEELQLRLSTIAPEAPSASTAAPVPVPAPAPVPTPAPGVATPAKTAPAAAAPEKPAPEKPAPEKSTPERAPAEMAPVVKAPAAKASRPPSPSPAAAGDLPWGWIAGGIAAFLLVLALLFARRRSRSNAAEGSPALEETPSGLLPVRGRDALEVAEAPVAARREMASDAGLATDVSGGDTAMLRRRYIEERFPEIARGAIVPGDPDSVVKSARLFYEDGAVSRATELLQYCTEEDPGSPRPWLALFEIYRLERMAREYAALAQRFREHHVKGGHWRKVQFFGREIDPDNALYRDLSVGIETIAFEAGRTPVVATFDPVVENWLDAPMDFENEVLAAELRQALMADAGVAEGDLVPNPMPALRSVEMFTVA